MELRGTFLILIFNQRKRHAIVENLLKSEAAFLTSLKIADQVSNNRKYIHTSIEYVSRSTFLCLYTIHITLLIILESTLHKIIREGGGLNDLYKRYMGIKVP